MTRDELDRTVEQLRLACDEFDLALAHAADPELMLLLQMRAQEIAVRLQAIELEALNAADALLDSLTETSASELRLIA